MNLPSLPTGPALLRRLCRTTLLLAAPLALGACDGLFDVDNPVDILAEDLEDPRVIPALSNSAEAAVVDAYDIAVQYGELVADGAIHVSSNQGNVALDRGNFGEFNERTEAVYNDLSSAQWAATEVTERLEALVEDPSTDAAVGRSVFWDATARITLADLFEEVTFDGGPPVEPVQVYRDAIALLERAAGIFEATGDTEYRAASYGMIARTYRSLYFEEGNDPAHFEAAAEAARTALELDPDFRIDARYQPPGSENALGTSWDVSFFYDVMDPVYANRVDPVGGELDPRIQHGPFSGQISPFGDSTYQQLKYPERGSDIRVISWQEVKLILAEYNLMLDNLSQAAGHMSDVRAAAGLPSVPVVSEDQLWDQLIYERSTEFWLELRRWQDMRYYDIIPERWDPAMKQAGVDRRFPVSLRERSTNPNY